MESAELLERHRVELTRYCHRMLGSAFEAEDAVQDTMVRAWRSYDRFEGRSALRTWLYRIATNVCIDMLDGRRRRARPVDVSSVAPPSATARDTRSEDALVRMTRDDTVVGGSGDPAEVAIARETVRLAFVVALRHLPPRQRAVLILCEVLRWHAAEVAELLDTTVQSVNSARYRSRATLASRRLSSAELSEPADPEQRTLLAQHVEAFERYDLEFLVTLVQRQLLTAEHGPSLDG